VGYYKSPSFARDSRVADIIGICSHSAIGYVTPQDKLEGKEKDILAERDRKLQDARERRKIQRQSAR